MPYHPCRGSGRIYAAGARGEYVLIVAGAEESGSSDQVTMEQAVGLVRRLAADGASLSDAARQIAKETGYRKGELYRQALEAE